MRPPPSYSLILAAAVLAAACQPKIGNSCRIHSDCSASGGRLCLPDLTTDTVANFPGGYCTIFNCDPGSCPDEAACVAYGTVPSMKPGCGNVLDQRFLRTFCMRSCTSNDDCRASEGYACVDVGPKDNPWGAVVVDGGRSSSICAIPASGTLSPAMAAQEAPGVCRPEIDASFPPLQEAAPASSGSVEGGPPDAGPTAAEAAP